MTMILHIIRITVTIFFVSGLTALIKKDRKNTIDEDKKDGKIILRMPRIFFWLGVITGAFFAVIMILFIIFSDTIISDIIVFSLLVLLSGSLLAVSTFWKIEFRRSEDFFYYTNMFGKKNKVFYKDVTYVNIMSDKLVFKVDKKRYSAYSYAYNYKKFLSKIKEKTDIKVRVVAGKELATANGKKVGAVKRAMSQLEEPMVFVFFGCLMSIMYCSMVVFLILVICTGNAADDQIAMYIICIIVFLIIGIGHPILFVFAVNNRKKYPRLARSFVKKGYFIDE